MLCIVHVCVFWDVQNTCLRLCLERFSSQMLRVFICSVMAVFSVEVSVFFYNNCENHHLLVWGI